MCSSSLKYIPLGNTHQCILWAREPRIHIISPGTEAYPTCHSWIITTHVSLGGFKKQWKMFVQQKARSHELVNSLQQKPLAQSYLLSTLQAESVNLDSICTSYKPLIPTATQPLKREPSFNGLSSLGKCIKRNLLPFLGEALSWLTRTAMNKDVRYIKRRVNQFIKTQTQQQETLVQVILILNITRHAMHINRQHINAVM